MQTVWVAGGAGFIGSNLCYSLIADYNVVCIDNLLTSSEDNIAPLKANKNFSFFKQDITLLDKKTASELPKPDFIFHLASPASPNAKSKRSYIALPLETMQANSFGTQNLLEIAKEAGARFLYASTSEVYGDPLISPQSETYWGNVNPVGPRSVYDESKRFGEAIIMLYVRKFGLNARMARIFNTFGPKMQIDDGRVVSNFIIQALKNEPFTVYGDGSQTRSFCYISDLVEGLKKLMFTDLKSGEIINLGNPNEQTIKSLADKIKNLIPTKSEVVHESLYEDDPKRRCPDISKAKQLLGWEPKVALEDGLKSTIEYFKNVL